MLSNSTKCKNSHDALCKPRAEAIESSHSIIRDLCLIGVFAVSLANVPSASASAPLNGKPNPSAVEKALKESREKLPAAKLSGSQQKIGNFLRPMIQRQKSKVAQPVSPMVNLKSGDNVQVYVKLTQMSPENLDALQSAGLNIELSIDTINKVQGWINLSQIEKLADLDQVERVTVPSYGQPAAGSVTTQGDRILQADQLRALGASGQGVKVGIISDGANNWRTAAATGDLPQNVTTFGSCATRAADPQNCRSRLTCNEGTAMAEIVHDIAPDAELAVAAVSTSLEFIQQINRLANVFNADIIVDDLGFFGEPYFEDGDLARAVSALPADILYFSSAGNSGNTHYEQQYATFSTSRHNFGVQNGANDDAIGFQIRPNRGAFVLLQWSDRYESPNSNYDLFVFDDSSQISSSAGPNQTAIEGSCIFNGSSSDIVRFAVVDKISGSNRRLEMFFLGASAIEYPIAAGSVFGHAGTRRAIAVGAINAGSSSAAFYSSHGPALVEFPSRDVRPKPDIAATDGVSVTGAGGFPSPFFGTSAAAPHAAAVAAQLLSAGPDVTPNQVRSVLLGTASGGGSSAAVGSGQISAIRALGGLGIELDSDGELPTLEPEAKPVVTPQIMLLLDDK